MPPQIALVLWLLFYLVLIIAIIFFVIKSTRAKRNMNRLIKEKTEGFLRNDNRD